MLHYQRKQWQPTPVLLPGKSHGRKSLVGCSPWSREESETTERLHFHFSLSCVGEGNGNPHQCFCLENPREGGAWWAAVHGVTQSGHGFSDLADASFLFFCSFALLYAFEVVASWRLYGLISGGKDFHRTTKLEIIHIYLYYFSIIVYYKILNMHIIIYEIDNKDLLFTFIFNYGWLLNWISESGCVLTPLFPSFFWFHCLPVFNWVALMLNTCY